MRFLDDALRDNPVGVWHDLPRPPHFQRKSFDAGLSRLSLWRVSTRDEILRRYKWTMSLVYKKFFTAVFCGIGALLAFYLFATGGDVLMAIAAVVLVALASNAYAGAAGGLAGGWYDYENDPVRCLVHNAYIENGGYGMMANWPIGPKDLVKGKSVIPPGVPK